MTAGRDPVAAAAEAFEAALGDPWDPDHPLSLRRAVELDEAEAFPEDAVRALDEAGLPARYVPAEIGGALENYEEMGYLVRAVARRDLTLIIAHAKTYLGAAAVWIAGTEAQRRSLARTILAGVPVSLGLTERDHGSDLVAGELCAEPSGEGFALSGEKWLINNATRSGALTVLARTEARGGFRGHSLFLVDKSSLPPERFRHLPKVRTLGIRGADISGIAFDRAEVGPEALVGERGHGLEITLKLLQLTRTNVAALSLGAVDTALRTVLDFAAARRLYGGPVIELPHARHTLAGVFADLLASECLAAVSCRALHVAPEEMAALSAITKYQVPTLAEGCIQRLGVILGARSYLREAHGFGAFQKIARDNPLVSLFDGSTVVNLHALGLQLRALGGGPAARSADGAALFGLGGPLPPVDTSRLALGARRSSVEALLPEAIERIAAAGESPAILALARRVQDGMAAVRAGARELHAAAPARFSRSPALFDLARRYAALHTAACCVGVWAHERDRRDPFFARGDWLAVAGARLLAAAEVPAEPPPEEHVEAVAAHMLALHREDALFSLRSIALPPRAGRDAR